MKYLFIVFCLFTVVSPTKAQNPESGWWWSFTEEEDTRNTLTDKFEGMGSSETATGKIAVEFSSTNVVFYYDGFMGKDYKTKKEITVLSRKMREQDEKTTVYEYNGSLNNKGVRIIVEVLNKDSYNSACIYLYEDYSLDRSKYNKCTIYKCIREYK